MARSVGEDIDFANARPAHGSTLNIFARETRNSAPPALGPVRHLPAVRKRFAHSLSPRRGSQAPGTYFQYQNWDFNAAGAAFEKLTGKDIFDALETDVARPIGMQDVDRARQRKHSALPWRDVFRHPATSAVTNAAAPRRDALAPPVLPVRTPRSPPR
jgi:CubicO group peptidase (beta-lactamase class C family)